MLFLGKLNHYSRGLLPHFRDFSDSTSRNWPQFKLTGPNLLPLKKNGNKNSLSSYEIRNLLKKVHLNV